MQYLPEELSRVNFMSREVNRLGEVIQEYPMEYQGGFIGLKQNENTMALRPEIGWMVGKPIKENVQITPNDKGPVSYWNMIDFPIEVLKHKEIDSLDISFLEEIKFPEEIKNINIRRLSLNGIISVDEKRRGKELLPKTMVFINGGRVN